MKTIEASTITVHSGTATNKERAEAGEALMEATHRIDHAGKDLLCALMSLCRFPEPQYLDRHDWDEAVAHVMKAATGSPEFLSLQGFVKQRQSVLAELSERIAKVADTNRLPLEWVNGHP